MLLRLYYLYHNSPKKSKELGEDLRQVYHYPKGGVCQFTARERTGSAITLEQANCRSLWSLYGAC